MRLTPIPNSFFEDHFQEMTSSERSLFFAMSFLSWGKHGKPDLQINQEELQSFCGLSHVTVSECLRSLEAKKLIAILEPPKKDSPTKYWVFGELPKNEPTPKTDITNWHDRKKLECKIGNALFQKWLTLLEQKIMLAQGWHRPGSISSGSYAEYFFQKVWWPLANKMSMERLWQLEQEILIEEKTPDFISAAKFPL